MEFTAYAVGTRDSVMLMKMIKGTAFGMGFVVPK